MIKTLRGKLILRENRFFLSVVEDGTSQEMAIHFTDAEKFKLSELLNKKGKKEEKEFTAAGLCNLYAEPMAAAMGFAGYVFPGNLKDVQQVESKLEPAEASTEA